MCGRHRQVSWWECRAGCERCAAPAVGQFLPRRCVRQRTAASNDTRRPLQHTDHTPHHTTSTISATHAYTKHTNTHTHSYNDTTTQMTVYTCCLMMCRPARPVDANTSRRCASSQSYLVLLMRWVNSSSIVIVLHMTHASHTVTLTLTFIIWPHPSCNLTILWFKRCGVNKQRYYNMTFFMNDDNETRTTDLFCSGK